MARNKKQSNDFMKVVTVVVLILMIAVVIAVRVIGKIQLKPIAGFTEPETVDELLNQFLPTNEDAAQLQKSLLVAIGTDAMIAEKDTMLTKDAQEIAIFVSKPAGEGPFPVLIIAHDGESSTRTTQRIAETVGKEIMERANVITVTVDWRESTAGEEDLLDVTSAVAYMQVRQESDKKNIFFMGIGHGGYLALRSLGEEEDVVGAINAYGYTDVAKQYAHLLEKDSREADNFLEQTGCHTATSIADCLEELSIRPSDIGDKAVLLVHHTNDAFVPFADNTAWVESLGDTGDVTLQAIPTQFDTDPLSYSDSTGYSETIDDIVIWFQEHLVATDIDTVENTNTNTNTIESEEDGEKEEVEGDTSSTSDTDLSDEVGKIIKTELNSQVYINQ